MIYGKIARHAAAAFLLVFLSGTWQTVSAYTPGACRQDGEKLCPGITNDKELIPCLKQHEAELSMDCKVNFAELREVVRQTKDACEPDIKAFCADVKTGQGRLRRCLKAHETELSAPCKAQVAAAREKYQINASTPATPVDQPATK